MDKRNRTSLCLCPSAEPRCQLNSFPSFPLSALATDLGLGFPLPGFPIRPSQCLGSCDPGISWLDMAVNSDLDLDKRFGSGLQQVSCSARDFSLAPVRGPSSATRLGISGSISRSGSAPSGPYLDPDQHRRVLISLLRVHLAALLQPSSL